MNNAESIYQTGQIEAINKNREWVRNNIQNNKNTDFDL